MSVLKVFFIRLSKVLFGLKFQWLLQDSWGQTAVLSPERVPRRHRRISRVVSWFKEKREGLFLFQKEESLKTYLENGRITWYISPVGLWSTSVFIRRSSKGSNFQIIQPQNQIEYDRKYPMWVKVKEVCETINNSRIAKRCIGLIGNVIW